jgi:hypothetical protein
MWWWGWDVVVGWFDNKGVDVNGGWSLARERYSLRSTMWGIG